MEKFLLTVFIMTLLSGCAVKTIPIKGSYSKQPFQMTTSNSFDQVWDKLIDLFAQKGLPIKIIDRSSGLIISERSVLTTTVETKDGKLKNPNAFLVIPQIYDPGPRKYYPITRYSDVSGEWNVRIKQLNNETIINVNIVNVKYQSYDAYHKINRDVTLTTYQSTGEFENLIADIIK